MQQQMDLDSIYWQVPVFEGLHHLDQTQNSAFRDKHPKVTSFIFFDDPRLIRSSWMTGCTFNGGPGRLLPSFVCGWHHLTETWFWRLRTVDLYLVHRKSSILSCLSHSVPFPTQVKDLDNGLSHIFSPFPHHLALGFILDSLTSLLLAEGGEGKGEEVREEREEEGGGTLSLTMPAASSFRINVRVGRVSLHA